MKWFYLISLSFGLNPSDNLVVVSPSQLRYEEVLSLSPAENHHFNLKSPQSCGRGTFLEKTETRIQCRWASAGQQSLEIFVCDLANTFCKRENLSIYISYPESLTQWKNYLLSLFSQ